MHRPIRIRSRSSSKNRPTITASPAWSPDGKLLAFGRVVDDPVGPARFELIIQDAPGQNRVLTSQKIENKPANRPDWSCLSAAWSPDGRYLAIPDLSIPSGICVVQVDNGRRLKTFDGTSPAWSPDGTKLAFIRERTSSLIVVEVGLDLTEKPATPAVANLAFGPPRYLVDLGQHDKAPVWSREGKAINAIAQRKVARGSGPTLLVDLLHIRLDSGSAETVARFNAEPIEDEKKIRGVCSTQDRDLDDLFFSLDIEGQPAIIVWGHPRNKEVVDRFNPVDFLVDVSSLAFSPDGKTLAIRFGDSATSSTVALFDLPTRKLTLLAPDDDVRGHWLALLIETSRRLLQGGLPSTAIDGRTVARPTILPVRRDSRKSGGCPSATPTGPAWASSLRCTRGGPNVESSPGAASTDRGFSSTHFGKIIRPL